MQHVTDACLAALQRVSTATLTTALFKRGLRNTFMRGVRPLARYPHNLVGPAFTLRNIPAREDIDRVEGYANPDHPQRKAVETVPPGRVLVVDCRGEAHAASLGEILMTRLAVRGVAGMVSDGGIRDAGPIAALAIPVFCAGPAAPLSIVAHHAIEPQVPIGCGGVAVYPGDLIVGDADGVVVLPAHLAEDIAAEADAQEQMEAWILRRVQDGARLPGTYPPDEATRAAYAAWRAQQG